tara:strand:+ start:1076 stop:2620 length:1545 start_codon:yes stop_codon:yes gene_type:complete
MAERKRRPASSKVKPGTPHPTKAYTVRGYDGKWISRKAFNAAKKVRAAKEKGGALVKRTSSAVTKAANKAGELLKIRKGDKGIVRGIKDTYKLGKDTRKSARAAYKAGQITREVYDKVVKGGKDFFGGVKESGKAVKRVVNRMKPGGKIVRTSKDAPKFNYDALPKQKGGAIVKNSGGKIVKNSGGKLVKNSGGKITTTRKPQYKVDADKKASTAKSNARKAKRWDDAKMKQTRAAKGSGSTPGKKPIITKQTSTATKVNRFVKNNAPKVGKGIKAGGKKLSKLLIKTGVVGNVAGKALMLNDLAHGVADNVRDVGNIYRKAKKKPLLKRIKVGNAKFGTDFTDKRVDRLNKNLAETGSYSGKTNKPKVKKKGTTRFSDTDETMTKGNIYTQDKNGNFVRITERDINEAGVVSFLEKQKTNPVKEGTSSSPTKGEMQPKKKTELQVKKSGSNTPYWQSPRYSSVKKKKTEAELKKDWLKKTKNSPARKSGAFTDDQLWNQQKKHQKWKKANNRR